VLRKLLPKRDQFYGYMEEQVAKAVEVTRAFRVFINDTENAREHLDQIKRIEHEADTIVHEVNADLIRTFVTPLDRNDINAMAKLLDDVTDHVEGVAQRMYHYELRTCTEPLTQLVDVIEKQAEYVQKIIGQLSDLKRTTEIKACLVEVHTLENEADDILRPAIAELFRGEGDLKLVIKWKEVYERLELTTDCYEDIADLVETLLLEYA